MIRFTLLSALARKFGAYSKALTFKRSCHPCRLEPYAATAIRTRNCEIVYLAPAKWRTTFAVFPVFLSDPLGVESRMLFDYGPPILCSGQVL